MIALIVDGKNVWTDELQKALEKIGWPEWDESGNVTHSITRPDVFGFNGFHLLSQTVGYEERYSIPATTAYLHIKEHLRKWCEARGIWVIPIYKYEKEKMVFWVRKYGDTPEEGDLYAIIHGQFGFLDVMKKDMDTFPDELSALVAAVNAMKEQ